MPRRQIQASIVQLLFNEHNLSSLLLGTLTRNKPSGYNEGDDHANAHALTVRDWVSQ